MKISDAGITMIKNFEGFSGKAYRCPAGKITIGFGHTAPELTMRDSITRARAEEILKHDLEWAAAAVNKYVKVDITQPQFDALVSLVFNIGAGAFMKSTLLKILNKGQYDAVPAQLARWNKVGSKASPGLTRRRQAEADMWLQSSDIMPLMAQEVTSPDKPISKSRTIAGAGLTGVATVAQETASQIEPLVPYADTLKIVFLSLALLGIAITIYARWDDSRKGV
jgi:lysozyme